MAKSLECQSQAPADGVGASLGPRAPGWAEAPRNGEHCWEMVGKEKLFIFSTLRAFPAVEGNDKRRETILGSCSRVVPPVSLPHLSGADAERGCSAHLALPPRTLEATPLLSQLLSEGTELPQLP